MPAPGEPQGQHRRGQAGQLPLFSPNPAQHSLEVTWNIEQAYGLKMTNAAGVFCFSILLGTR